jgi:hypothetical protein
MVGRRSHGELKNMDNPKHTLLSQEKFYYINNARIKGKVRPGIGHKDQEGE